MNAYQYPPHQQQQSPQHLNSQQQQQQHHQSQSSPTAAVNPNQAQSHGSGINPAMLQGAQHASAQGGAGGRMPGAAAGMSQQAQMLARQQQMMAGMGGGGGGGMGGMNGMASLSGMGNMSGMGAASGMGGMSNMGNMGMPNGAMNMNMANRINSMNMPGMGGMSGMGMNNMGSMDLFKPNNVPGGAGGGSGGMNMGLDNGMTINPAMLGSANPNANGGAGMSPQDLQKVMAARQAALGMSGMNNMGGMNNMAGMNGMGSMAGMGGMAGMGSMGSLGGMNEMNGMNMGMNMMGASAQQQAMMQQYLAQQQARQQQQAQSQSHSPQSATHTPASASGGNPYPPFPPQSQSQQMQGQNVSAGSMPPPPPRPNTAMSASSQHGIGMGIPRPPSTMHNQQAMHGQQPQQMGHGSISRPGTASGFRPSSSAGEAPRTPHTPNLANQQGSGGMQSMGQGQGQHVREPSHPPSRPQTAASNHGSMQSGMNGKYPMGVSGMGGAGGMNNMGNMGNMSSMPGMNLMGGAGGGMMPPPTIPRQGSLGPSSQPQSSMQPPNTPHGMHHNQQHGMMPGHGHGSPLSASAPGSAGLQRTPSIGEGLGGMGAGMGGAGMDDPMGNMSGMNTGLGMGSGMSNAAMTPGMGIGVGGIGGIGVGGIGGMSQMQHMQEMQQRKAIALNEYHKQQAARQQQLAHQQQQQQHQGPTPNSAAVVPSPGAAIPSAGMSAGPGADAQGINMAQGHVPANQISIPGAGMNVGMGAMGTPTRPPTTGRTSMPPPPGSAAAMSMGGVAPLSGASSGVSAGTVPPPATSASGASVSPSVNGAAAPTSAANGSASTSSAANAQNALAASLPPLPAGVLNQATTRMTVIPISESAKQIPPLSQEEIEKVAGWLKTDREYEARFRAMVTRSKAELAVLQRPRWWERDTNPAAIAAAQRRPKEKFELSYPHGAPQSREAAAAAARRRGRRREGLKIPGRLKDADAERGEQLVPIRLEFDVEHHKYRDTFVWNLNDPIVTPEAFAQSLIDDYGLSSGYHSQITKQIQEQLSDFKAHTATLVDVSNDLDLSSNGMDVKAPPIHGLIKDDSDEAKFWASWRGKLRTRTGAVKTNALLKELAAEMASMERSRKRKRSAVEKEKGREKEKGKNKDATATAATPATPVTAASASAEELKPIPGADQSMDVEMRDAEEDIMHEEMRIEIKIDVTVGEMKLDDTFEWDIENADPTPEQFAEVYCTDLGLSSEFKTAVAHSIREQVSTYQKSLFLVGHPSDGSAVQDDDLRMSFIPTVTFVTRPLDQTTLTQPVINYLSDGELDRLDKEREKEANKRRKRNTRGRRGITLPDREPIRTHRTPAIGFPEIDPSTLALAAAAAAPTSRRAAAAAASVTIANMVASENGTTVLPQVTPQPSVPTLPTSKVPKPRGSFKAPSYPSSVLKSRANITSPTPSTMVDSAVHEPPLEGDAPLPVSAPATPSAPPSKATNVPMTARRQRELEKEAKEREFADGQRANMINGVWHCSNCGCPDSVAVGRRKGPLGDKSQCGACGKFWHRHRRPRPVEYHTDPEYHLNLKMESERAKASAKKRGGAAALRALNQQQKQDDQAATPASVPDEPASPAASKNEVWVEINKSTKKASVVADGLDLDRPLSPASDISSSASEKPLAQGLLQANGTASVSRPASAAATPLKGSSELPVHNEASSSVTKPAHAPPLKESSSSEPPSATPASATPGPDSAVSQGPPMPRPVRPQWQEGALAEMQARYPDDRFEIILRKQNNGNQPEWRVKCLDCPGKLYTPGPGESLSNFEVHLKNRQHRAKVHGRLHGGAAQT
ncbi:SNF5-domain-containing protein [Fomitiporia mediterranea MF3/22]|uniref:SNF5-domain-containing protein n=1 Tax=Fomitiporia mediterranea (strain MF3/22) TaxID=694068 RepID=UPI0004409B09|nr:SNF5-domain-containing protein [Fomitiporia mediterranea MF3/22]EJD02050.1 SNF5-domain-containing protein [Fomitiporia mediterranea MF3/22]